MLTSQDSLRLLLVAGLLVVVGLSPLLLRNRSTGQWLRALPRYGWWIGVGCVCLFATGRQETEWTLAVAQWVLLLSLVLIAYVQLAGPAEDDDR